MKVPEIRIRPMMIPGVARNAANLDQGPGILRECCQSCAPNCTACADSLSTVANGPAVLWIPSFTAAGDSTGTMLLTLIRPASDPRPRSVPHLPGRRRARGRGEAREAGKTRESPGKPGKTRRTARERATKHRSAADSPDRPRELDRISGVLRTCVYAGLSQFRGRGTKT
ncbi:hypothetical protein GCM10023205_76170 [Yinghuangia aomiensis]|uniref:Uncharacterized protein n=1 Tax=Yinghuangia aomiensis TaxID=676205 RepID=A0ABP9IAF8_9ACTN